MSRFTNVDLVNFLELGFMIGGDSTSDTFFINLKLIFGKTIIKVIIVHIYDIKICNEHQVQDLAHQILHNS